MMKGWRQGREKRMEVEEGTVIRETREGGNDWGWRV